MRRLHLCALIGHFLLYSVTIKCLNFPIFWTPDEVGDETSVWWVTNFCVAGDEYNPELPTIPELQEFTPEVVS